MMTLLVGLTELNTSKDRRDLRGRSDLLYDQKGHGDLYRQFDIAYDPKTSQGP